MTKLEWLLGERACKAIKEKQEDIKKRVGIVSPSQVLTDYIPWTEVEEGFSEGINNPEVKDFFADLQNKKKHGIKLKIVLKIKHNRNI